MDAGGRGITNHEGEMSYAERSAQATVRKVWQSYWKRTEQQERDARPVLDLEAGRTYDSTSAAAKALRVSVAEVRRQLAIGWLVWLTNPLDTVERAEVGKAARPNIYEEIWSEFAASGRPWGPRSMRKTPRREKKLAKKEHPMNERLKAIRAELKKAPKHLQSTPTCIPIPEAAKRLGVSGRELRRRMSRRRWRAFSLDGVAVVPVSLLEMLGGAQRKAVAA